MRIWRAGDLLLPTRATSSCHRCRSRAGWRDRQVLSGCKSSLYHTVISYQSKYARDLDDFARRALYLKVAAGVARSSTGKEMSPVPRLLSECLDDPTAKSQCEGRPRTLRLRRTADQGRAALRLRLAPPSRLQLVRTAVTTLPNRVITGARHGPAELPFASECPLAPRDVSGTAIDPHRFVAARPYVLLLKRHRLGELYHWLCKPSERRVPCRIGRTQDSATSQI